MGHTAGQPAQRVELLGLRQLILDGAHFRYVGECDGCGIRRGLARAKQRRGAHSHPGHRVIAALNADHHVRDTHAVPERDGHWIFVVRKGRAVLVDQRPHRIPVIDADDFVGADPQDSFRARVAGYDRP